MLVFPRQPGHDRICLTDFYRPKDSGERDVVAIQAVTAGPQVTELMASLEQQGEFAEQLYTHGLGVQTAEGMAEWLHARVRSSLGIAPDLDVGFEAAAAFRSNYMTAYYALQRGRLRAGETLLVHGAAGGVGLATVDMGKLTGARVIGTARNPERLAVCKQHAQQMYPR